MPMLMTYCGAGTPKHSGTQLSSNCFVIRHGFPHGCGPSLCGNERCLQATSDRCQSGPHKATGADPAIPSFGKR